MYKVKELFYSLQGEGDRSGRPAVFCRFTGCNAWSGLERDKASSACPFCDTNFVGVDGQNGGKYTIDELVRQIKMLWPTPLISSQSPSKARPYIVFTGGEPLLQLDKELIDAVHAEGFEIAVETNGSQKVPEGIDWLCVSPKEGLELVAKKGNELKLLFPLKTLKPEDVDLLKFDQFFLQPIDDEQAKSNQQQTLKYCLENPQWQYSFQLHKLLVID